MLSPAQAQQLLVTWNQTQTNYPQDKCIHQLFEECVALNGEAIALKFNDTQLTYRELNHRANQLANHLIATGISAEDLIGIAIDRSIETIVGMLGYPQSWWRLPTDRSDGTASTAGGDLR